MPRGCEIIQRVVEIKIPKKKGPSKLKGPFYNIN